MRWIKIFYSINIEAKYFNSKHTVQYSSIGIWYKYLKNLLLLLIWDNVPTSLGISIKTREKSNYDDPELSPPLQHDPNWERKKGEIEEGRNTAELQNDMVQLLQQQRPDLFVPLLPPLSSVPVSTVS